PACMVPFPSLVCPPQLLISPLLAAPSASIAFSLPPLPPTSPLFPYTTLFRSSPASPSPERRLLTLPSPPAIPARAGRAQWPRERVARSASASLLRPPALGPLR